MCVFISHRQTPTWIPQLPIGNTCTSTENQFAFWGGYLCLREIQKNRAGVDTDTLTYGFLKKIIWEDSKGDLSQRLIYANWQKNLLMLMEYQAVKTHPEWSLLSALVTWYNLLISNSVIIWSLKSSVYCSAMAYRLHYDLRCWKLLVLFWSLVILQAWKNAWIILYFFFFSAFSSKFKTRFPAFVVSLYWKWLILIRLGLLICLNCCFWKERKKSFFKVPSSVFLFPSLVK